MIWFTGVHADSRFVPLYDYDLIYRYSGTPTENMSEISLKFQRHFSELQWNPY